MDKQQGSKAGNLSNRDMGKNAVRATPMGIHVYGFRRRTTIRRYTALAFIAIHAAKIGAIKIINFL